MWHAEMAKGHCFAEKVLPQKHFPLIFLKHIQIWFVVKQAVALTHKQTFLG